MSKLITDVKAWWRLLCCGADRAQLGVRSRRAARPLGIRIGAAHKCGHQQFGQPAKNRPLKCHPNQNPSKLLKKSPQTWRQRLCNAHWWSMISSVISWSTTRWTALFKASSTSGTKWSSGAKRGLPSKCLMRTFRASICNTGLNICRLSLIRLLLSLRRRKRLMISFLKKEISTRCIISGCNKKRRSLIWKFKN